MLTPWLARRVGLIVMAAAALMGLGLYLFLGGRITGTAAVHYISILNWDIPIGRIEATDRVFLASLAVALFGILLVFLVESALILRSRGRFGNTVPLSPGKDLSRKLEDPEEVLDGPQPGLLVLVPAHNEAASIGATLDHLMAVATPQTRIVVIADNCTDATASIALARGAEVFTTVDNVGKKGGALNQALASLLPSLPEDDIVMVVDADTLLSPDFVEVMLDEFATDPGLMAVGGLFQGDTGGGLVGQFQRNEYIRYSREIRRSGGRVFVLTGTASGFRVKALRTVAAMRGTKIPGTPGCVYADVLTEDNELTLALKSLGAPLVSPDECIVTTEIMPTWRNLWNQRLRWQRGAVENIGAYGLTTATARSWMQQVGLGYGVIAFFSFALLMLIALVLIRDIVIYPFWMAIGAIFILERVVTVWRGGWVARGLAVLIIPELLYAMFLSVVFAVGVVRLTAGTQASWGHVQHASVGEVE